MSKMLKLKRCVLVMLSLALVIGVVAGVMAQAKREKKVFVLPDTSSAETETSRYTQYYDAAKISGKRLNTKGYKKVLENENLELWLREEIASIRVVDKKSGYVWGELKADEVDDLNEYWAAMANSMFTVEYYDQNNTAYQMSMCEDTFQNVYSFDDDADVMYCTSDAYDIGLAFNFTIALKDDHIEMEVDSDSIDEYDPNFVLAKIYLLPFFGCTPHQEMDGYIFVPDGSGALMRFDENTLHTSSYTAKLYGPDGGIDTLNTVNDLMAKRTDDYLVDVFRATIPVYGIVHGDEQYAAMTVVESGNDYASIKASLASVITPYNWVGSIFEYRMLYSQPVSKSSSIIRPQEKINNFKPKVSIYLLSDEDASYSGMAKKYRELLEEDGTLADAAKVYEEQIPLRLEVLASDVKQGFIFNGVQTITTVDHAKEMQNKLAGKGIKNLTMVMNGWQKGGSNGNAYGNFATQNTVGSLDQLASLRDSVKNAGGNFYLQNKAVTFNASQGRTSYLATQSIAKKLVYYLRDNPSVMFPETYLASPQTIYNNIATATDALKGFNLSLPRYGSELYSHHEQEGVTTRGKFRKMLIQAAEKAEKKGAELSMSAPNHYMWKNVTDYFDIPMMNSQYLFESDSVPFLQILLKGYINYYAPYANQGFYTNACTLKSIEYGAYPSFLVMNADNGSLNKTPMVDYFSLNFEDWKGTIEEVYNKVNAALKEVEGAKISEHKVLKEGVVRVTYDNGVKIYINYTSDVVKVDGVKIAKQSYAVERG